jgi:hypothetical protein
MISTLLHLLRLCPFLCGGHRQLAFENLALRQQLTVYRRTVARPRLRRGNRLFWVALSRLWRGWKQALIIVALTPSCAGSGDGSASTGLPPGPDPGQPDPEEAISPAKLGPGRRSLVHGELLAQGELLQGELAVAAADEREESKQVEQECDHRAGILSGSEPTYQPLGRRNARREGTECQPADRLLDDVSKRARRRSRRAPSARRTRPLRFVRWANGGRPGYPSEHATR